MSSLLGAFDSLSATSRLMVLSGFLLSDSVEREHQPPLIFAQYFKNVRATIKMIWMVSSVSSHTDYATKQHYCYVFKVRRIPVKASLLASWLQIMTYQRRRRSEIKSVCVCVAGVLRIKLQFFKRKESPTYNSDTLFTWDSCNAQDIVEYGGTQRFFVL